MNTFSAVLLIVNVITANGEAPMRKEQMPDMETCIMELGKFLQHKFPDSINAKKLKAECDGDLVEDNPS